MQPRKIKKVLFDARAVASSQPTGVGYYTKGVIESLAKNYPEVSFVGHYFLPYGKSDADFMLPLAKNVSYKRSRILPEKLVNQLRRFNLAPPFEFLTKTKGDINFFPAYVRQSSIFSTPSVITIHDMAYMNSPETVSNKNRQDLINFMPSSIDKSELILTVSEYSKTEIMKFYNVDENKILVHGLPPEKINTPSKNESEKILKKFRINKKFILFTGTLEPRKNIEWLISAYEALDHKTRDKYALVLAGGLGWKSDGIKKTIESSSENVIAVGYIAPDEKAVLMSECEALVMASREEGFGMPILEAASFGKSAILSDIPVFHEVAGDGAIFFEQKSFKSFANAVKSLDDKNMLTQKRTLAKKNLARYSWDTIATNIMNKLEEIAS
jgi:glycosyltransferase involved in cell wall biosynthesis